MSAGIWTRFCDAPPPEGGPQGDWNLMGWFPPVGHCWCERVGDRLLIGQNIMPIEQIEQSYGPDCWWLVVPSVPGFDASPELPGDQWTAVEDGLPPPDVTVLAVVSGYHWLAYRDATYGGIWCGAWENEYWRQPTHWRYLPALPVAPQAEESRP